MPDDDNVHCMKEGNVSTSHGRAPPAPPAAGGDARRRVARGAERRAARGRRSDRGRRVQHAPWDFCEARETAGGKQARRHAPPCPW